MALSGGGGSAFFDGLIAGGKARGDAMSRRAYAAKEAALERDRAHGREAKETTEGRLGAGEFQRQLTEMRDRIDDMQPHQAPSVYEDLQVLAETANRTGMRLPSSLNPQNFAKQYGLLPSGADENAKAAADKATSFLGAVPAGSGAAVPAGAATAVARAGAQKIVGDYRAAKQTEDAKPEWMKMGYGSPQAATQGINDMLAHQEAVGKLNYSKELPMAFLNDIEAGFRQVGPDGKPLPDELQPSWEDIAKDEVAWNTAAAELMARYVRDTGMSSATVHDILLPELAAAEKIQQGATNQQAALAAKEEVRTQRWDKIQRWAASWLGISESPDQTITEIMSVVDPDSSVMDAYRTITLAGNELLNSPEAPDYVTITGMLMRRFADNAGMHSNVKMDLIDVPGIGNMPDEYRALFDAANDAGRLPPGARFQFKHGALYMEANGEWALIPPNDPLLTGDFPKPATSLSLPKNKSQATDAEAISFLKELGDVEGVRRLETWRRATAPASEYPSEIPRPFPLGSFSGPGGT